MKMDFQRPLKLRQPIQKPGFICKSHLWLSQDGCSALFYRLGFLFLCFLTSSSISIQSIIALLLIMFPQCCHSCHPVATPYYIACTITPHNRIFTQVATSPRVWRLVPCVPLCVTCLLSLAEWLKAY
jgi:hypothetical protein